ncbi:MAG: hypothetical protein CR959_02265 [Fusobacteriales bacterium]|nr:MAG: hypothetical protein CR959_02265 [Fusobacteriales bacterium]
MFRVYTKEIKSKELFNVNLSKSEIANLMKGNLFLDHPEINKDDCVVIENQEFINPTWDGTELREMTRQECLDNGIDILLSDGEFIENNQLMEIKKPSQYHKWNGTEWTVNLDEIKSKKDEELKNKRNEEIASDIVVNGISLQARAQDIDNFRDVKDSIIDKEATPDTEIRWRCKDNIFRMFKAQDLADVVKIRRHRKIVAFKKFETLMLILEKATTVEEIEAIKWED